MDNKWTSKILSSLGVVRTETAPSQGKVTDSNRKYVAALALAATAALGGLSSGNAMADGYEASDLENPYLSHYEIAPQEKTFVNKANDLLNKIPGGYRHSSFSDDGSKDKGEKEKDKKKEKSLADSYYSEIVGDKTIDKIGNGVGIITSPVASLTEKISKVTVGAGATALSGNKDVGSTVGSMTGETLGAAVGFSVLPHVAIATASINAVRGVFHIAESLQMEDHRNAQGAVNDSRSRMAKIYEEERSRIQAEDAAKNAKSELVAKVGTSDLSTNMDISQLMQDKTKEKTKEGESPSFKM